MNKWKKHLSKLFLFPLLAIMVLAAGGCSSSPETAPKPAELPGASAIEANGSSVYCQVQMFGAWDGAFPREMTVLILESEDVEGLANYTKSKINQQIDVILDEDLDWLMLGQQITGRIQLRANAQGGESFYISNIVH
ncbi:MAG: hypothetical protein KAW90_05060 [Dehalococcoidales bacterium]|nr:hypothetical protein [Dehalococcoidales bacterium]